jgi:phosphate starvation-inducible protein PhoH and related proteins
MKSLAKARLFYFPLIFISKYSYMTDFNRTPEAQEVFKAKRKPKGPIKFNISLNEEQKNAKSKILSNTVTILRGKAGSGKSLLAANIALDLLFSREIEKIIITRPTVVAGQDIGFLPGDVNEKLAPFTAPVYENMHRLYNKEKIEKCIQDGEIEIVPVSFMRGRNFTDCLVVVDEAQNLTDNQTELLLTRICHGSKMIFCGDAAQVDLKDKKTSGFDVVCKHMKEVPGFEVVTLEKNHRHPIVDDILEVYKSFRG